MSVNAFVQALDEIPGIPDVLKIVTDFCYKHCNSDEIEIEAKLGEYRMNENDQRLTNPLQNEAILQESQGRKSFHFVPGLPPQYFNAFNQMLNRKVEQGKVVGYDHFYDTDRFYYSRGDTSLPKARHTLRKKSSKIQPGTLEIISQTTIRKSTIAHIEIVTPVPNFHARISANREEKLPGGLLDLQQLGYDVNNPVMERDKNRYSYNFGNFLVELTMVTTKLGQNVTTSHEIEIELNSSSLLSKRASHGPLSVGHLPPSGFISVIDCFLYNVRSFQRLPLYLAQQQQQQQQQQIQMQTQASPRRPPKKEQQQQQGDKSNHKGPIVYNPMGSEVVFSSENEENDVNNNAYIPSVLPPNWTGFGPENTKKRSRTGSGIEHSDSKSLNESNKKVKNG